MLRPTSFEPTDPVADSLRLAGARLCRSNEKYLRSILRRDVVSGERGGSCKDLASETIAPHSSQTPHND